MSSRQVVTPTMGGASSPPSWTSVLAVVAHPDDESFGLGAILDAFIFAGARVQVHLPHPWSDLAAGGSPRGPRRPSRRRARFGGRRARSDPCPAARHPRWGPERAGPDKSGHRGGHRREVVWRGGASRIRHRWGRRRPGPRGGDRRGTPGGRDARPAGPGLDPSGLGRGTAEPGLRRHRHRPPRRGRRPAGDRRTRPAAPGQPRTGEQVKARKCRSAQAGAPR